MSDHDHIGSLRPDPMNPRRHTSRNVGTIAHNIQRVGFGRPILISKGHQIIAGHATIEAAGQVGLEDMIVVPSDGTKVIAVMRVDVEDGSAEAAELGAGDNFAGDLADGYEPDLLRQLDEQFGIAEMGLWNDAEWAAALDRFNDAPFDPADEWRGMPAFEQEDLGPVKQLTVNFRRADDVAEFARVLGQNVSMATRSIWFPAEPLRDLHSSVYAEVGDAS